MVANHAPTQAMRHRRAAETVLRYILSSRPDSGRRAGNSRLPAEARALICLAGNTAIARLEERKDLPHDQLRTARCEQSFCRIADAQGWDDCARDRLEHLVEMLFEEPAVQQALAALLGLRLRRGNAADSSEIRCLLEQHLPDGYLALDAVRAALLEVTPSRRRPRRLRPTDRPSAVHWRPA